VTAAELALAREIGRACYGAELGIEPVGGSNNTLVRLYAPSGVKVLKLAREGQAGAVGKELRLIALLREHGLPAPVIEHADPDGGRHGRAFFAMAQSGERTVYDLLAEAGDTPRRLCREMGALQARFHAIELPGSGTILADRIEPSSPQPLLESLHAVSRALASEGLLSAEEDESFRALRLPPHQGESLCHGDFHAVQCVVRMGRIAAIVDWEAAWAGNPAIDCAVTQAYLEYYAAAELVRAWLEGYREHRALPADYACAYLPVRMVQVFGLLRAWREHGVWRGAVDSGRVARALELFRVYARTWAARSQGQG
jgi:aminoglycoside phosphotransferase (APT) family kinase protein